METLVRDLLAYTQIGNTSESGTKSIDSGTALERALRDLTTAIDEAGATISCSSLPRVRVPAVQLQQLFQNLISNAIKYRKDSEPPRVDISAIAEGRDWLFSIRDNGIGIAPEYHQLVFGVFKRLHTEVKYAGTGIGLAICQRIVERSGGRIWVESEGSGTGSTFYFTLPGEEV
jgi:light-regulated signal transduction histidine kinase (bacteriophytochrome)